MEEKSLITIEELNPEKVFTSVELRTAIVDKIRERASEHVADVSTVTSRKAIASNARKVASSKTWIDGIGKDQVATIKAKAKGIDSGRKYIRDELDAIRDEVRRPLTDWEEAEELRIEAKIAATQYDKDWDAAHVHNDLLNRERAVAEQEAGLKRKQEEADAKAAADRVEKDRIEREKRIAASAASDAKAEAERKVADEKLRLETEKKDAEDRAAKAEADKAAAALKAKADKEKAIEEARERAKREAEEKEADRIAKEKAAKAAADAKAADSENQAVKNRAAKASFMKIGFSSEDSEKAVRAIASNQIDNVYISY